MWNEWDVLTVNKIFNIKTDKATFHDSYLVHFHKLLSVLNRWPTYQTWHNYINGCLASNWQNETIGWQDERTVCSMAAGVWISINCASVDLFTRWHWLTERVNVGIREDWFSSVQNDYSIEKIKRRLYRYRCDIDCDSSNIRLFFYKALLFIFSYVACMVMYHELPLGLRV